MDTDSGGSSSPEREVKDIENEECCMDSLSTWSSGNTPSAASGKDDLMMIIRGTETQENQDIDQVKGHYHGFTSALAEQFDKDLSLSSDCNGAELDMTEEEEDNSSERHASSDSEFEQNEVSCDQNARGDQCITMETEGTNSSPPKEDREEEHDEEEPMEERIFHPDQLGRLGDCLAVKRTDTEADYVNLDFSLVEKTNSDLNISASKHRVVLRKKGSLAKRRKPSRFNIRASYCSPNLSMYNDSTELPQVQNLLDHGNTSDPSTPPDDAEPFATHLLDAPLNGDHSDLTATVASPVMLLGLTEASRVQLRSEPPVPVPHPHATSMTDASEPPNSSASWLCEALQPSKGQAEKLKSELEKPSWMKNVLARRKRRSDIFMLHEESREHSNQPEKEADMSTSHWSKDSAILRSNCPALTKVAHSDSHVNDTVNDATDASEQLKSDGSLHKMKAQKETLTPIRKRSTDGALVPSELARLAPDFIVGSAEDRPSRNTLPPLKGVSIPPVVADIDEHTDYWSDPVQLRMKTRTLIQPLNTNHQVAIGFVPPWKQELLEKKRKRESLPPPVERPKELSGNNLPPWKQELEQRRRTIVGVCPRVLEPIERDAEVIPEWAKSVQTRRTRLANCGLIQSEEEEVIEEPRTS